MEPFHPRMNRYREASSLIFISLLCSCVTPIGATYMAAHKPVILGCVDRLGGSKNCSRQITGSAYEDEIKNYKESSEYRSSTGTASEKTLSVNVNKTFRKIPRPYLQVTSIEVGYFHFHTGNSSESNWVNIKGTLASAERNHK